MGESTLKARLLARHLDPGCGGGSCPAVAQTNRGTYIVVGYQLKPEDVVAFTSSTGVNVAGHEQAVELPAELVERLLGNRNL